MESSGLPHSNNFLWECVALIDIEPVTYIIEPFVFAEYK